MANPERTAELVQQVKDAAAALEMASQALRRHNPNVRVEYETVNEYPLGGAFPIERLQVKLTEVKTL